MNAPNSTQQLSIEAAALVRDAALFLRGLDDTATTPLRDLRRSGCDLPVRVVAVQVELWREGVMPYGYRRLRCREGAGAEADRFDPAADLERAAVVEPEAVRNFRYFSARATVSTSLAPPQWLASSSARRRTSVWSVISITFVAEISGLLSALTIKRRPASPITSFKDIHLRLPVMTPPQAAVRQCAAPATEDRASNLSRLQFHRWLSRSGAPIRPRPGRYPLPAK